MRAALAVLALAGCASAPVDRMYVGHRCDGVELTVRYREYVSVAPAVDCIRLIGPAPEFVLAFPLLFGCWSGQQRIMVVPAIWSDQVREHELMHVAGWQHGLWPTGEWECPSVRRVTDG